MIGAGCFTLSSTARLSADAPFQVLADGEHVYVLRQSVAAGEQDRIVTVDGPNGTKVPVVDSTLLVDRFVLAGPDLVLRPVGARRHRPGPPPRGPVRAQPQQDPPAERAGQSGRRRPRRHSVRR